MRGYKLERLFTDLRNSIVAKGCKLITPSDTVDLSSPGFIMVLGDAGNVKVETVRGDVVTLPLDPKEIVPLLIRKVFNTDTTATSIYLLQ